MDDHVHDSFDDDDDDDGNDGGDGEDSGTGAACGGGADTQTTPHNDEPREDPTATEASKRVRGHDAGLDDLFNELFDAH